MHDLMLRVIEITGGKSALARKLGVHRQQIQQWEVPPVKYVKKIAALTNGKVSETALMRAILERKAA